MAILDFPHDPPPIEGDEWEDNDGVEWLFWRESWVQIGGITQEVVGVPTGMVAPFAGVVAPAEWLLCDGAEISREDYADLFAIVGDIYGGGDGSSTFNVPNLIDRVVSGAGAHTPGDTGGSEEIILIEGQLPSHGHSLSIDTVPNHSHSGSFTSGSLSGSTSSGGSHSHDYQTRAGTNLQTANQSGHAYGSSSSWPTTSHNGHTHLLSGVSVSGNVNVGDGGSHGHTGTVGDTGSGQPIDVRQPTIYMYAIIKT